MAKENEKYQGWTNYETWAVALMLGNEQTLYNQSRALVSGGTVYAAGERLKNWVTDANPLDDEFHHPPLLLGVFQQLLTGALQAVNWVEIAENFLTA
jgi:hypothetical protein